MRSRLFLASPRVQALVFGVLGTITGVFIATIIGGRPRGTRQHGARPPASTWTTSSC